MIAEIDAANAEDPFVIAVRGESGPKELLHAQLMTEWLLRLDPAASDAQQVAARAHHLRRWEHPRDDYPQGRAGYLKWRAAAKRAHAAAVAGILAAHGASGGFIDAVGRIIRKEGLGSDPAVQAHEDALCLVFLETQLDDVIASVGVDKAHDILVKTVRKMSPVGIAAAAGVELSEEARAALESAVDAGDSDTWQ